MEPLRIEFQLAGPWAPPSHGVHFDGLIAHAIVRETLRDAVAPELSMALSGGAEDQVYADLISALPFEKYESETGWCWKASKLLPVRYHGQERRYLTAKTPVIEMARAIGDGTVETKGGSIIDTVRGIGKNSALYYTLEHVEQLHAWCIGDRNALEYLLQDVRAVGMKTRLGHGALTQFDDGRYFRIVADEAAATKWQSRNLPDQLQADMYPGVGTTFPPYWKNKTYCWMPVPCEV